MSKLDKQPAPEVYQMFGNRQKSLICSEPCHKMLQGVKIGVWFLPLTFLPPLLQTAVIFI